MIIPIYRIMLAQSNEAFEAAAECESQRTEINGGPLQTFNLEPLVAGGQY